MKKLAGAITLCFLLLLGACDSMGGGGDGDDGNGEPTGAMAEG